MPIIEALKLVGAILGIIAFGWKVWDTVVAFLHIELSIEIGKDKSLSALTIVENKRAIPRRIDNALLLVGPEEESPIATFNKISGSRGNKVVYTNEIVGRPPDHQIHRGPEGRLLMPLPFYYSENIKIGDEKLSYRAPIDTQSIPSGTPYSIRFFIGSRTRYHRSTQDSFVL